MMGWLALSVLAATCAVSLLLSVLLVLQHWEFRRMVRSRTGYYGRKKDWKLPPVSLVVPVKGGDVGLKESLAALFQQDYPDYEVVFVVEDRADPAAEVIARLQREETTVPTRLIVSGRSSRVGQKVHNLLQATRKLSARTRVLAFVDADARPSPTWLRKLVDRTKLDQVGANTGYRWLIPEQQSLANLVLCSANSSVTALFGTHGLNIIWGGSWAVRREVFEACGIEQAWHGTLTEDVVATRQLRRHGLRVEFEPGCLCPSPVDMNWRQSLAFMRRQFFLVRAYAPLVWALGLLYATPVTLGFWTCLLLTLLLSASGGPGWWLASSTTAALYALGAFRAWLRQDAAKYCLDASHGPARWSRWFDLLAAPLASLVAWGAMLSAGFGRATIWRAIRYELDAAGQVVALTRLDESRPPASIPLPAPAAGAEAAPSRKAA